MDIREARELVAHMLGIRVAREPAWRDLSRWLCGWRGMFEERRDSYDNGDLKLFTGIASQAVLRGASGMSSGMTPRNSNWFKPAFTDESLLEAPGGRAWLDLLDMRMKECLAAGGFYQAAQNFNIDLIWSGCAMLYSEAGRECPLRFESVQVGTFCVALDNEGALEAVARRIEMTPGSAAAAFGEDALSDAARHMLKSQPYGALHVWHLAIRKQRGRYPLQSLYWEENGADFLRESGFYEMPYFYTVWNEGATPYGTGPGDQCLADAMQIDTLERRKLAGLGKLVDPPVTAPDHLKDIVDLSPGGINFSPMQDRITPILDLSPYAAAMRHLQEEIQTVARRLQDGLMATIFTSMPLDQRPRDMSATEFLERKREALQQLGPVISAYEPDVLTPLLFRTARALDRAGLTPPPPEALRNMPLLMKIDFISPMANALRQTAGEAVRALLMDMGNIAKMAGDPQIFDKLDLDQAVDELATAIGAPGSIVRSDEDVAEIRRQRRESQTRQEQMLEAAQAMPMLESLQNMSLREQEAGMRDMEQGGRNMRQDGPQDGPEGAGGR